MPGILGASAQDVFGCPEYEALPGWQTDGCSDINPQLGASNIGWHQSDE